MPNKLSDTRSLKTSPLTGEKNWLSKSSKHKQVLMLWSSGLQAFNSSVKHLTRLEERTQPQELSLTWLLPGGVIWKMFRANRMGAWPALWVMPDNGHQRGSPEIPGSWDTPHLPVKYTVVPLYWKVHTAGNGETCTEDCSLCPRQGFWIQNSEGLR